MEKMLDGTRKGILLFFVITVMIIQISWLNEDFCMAAAKGSSVLSADDKKEDAKIRAVWNAMRSALKAGNVNKTLDYFAEDAKDMYEYNFNLMKSHLDEISSSLSDIKLTWIGDGVAEYEMLGDYEGQRYNSLVRFVKDKNGIWKIKFF